MYIGDFDQDGADDLLCNNRSTGSMFVDLVKKRPIQADACILADGASNPPALKLDASYPPLTVVNLADIT
jgi:hypothetical protein